MDYKWSLRNLEKDSDEYLRVKSEVLHVLYIELHEEKICLLAFQTGVTQTKLYSCRKLLEA